MTKRLIIAGIVVALLCGLAWNFGLFSRFNYVTAKSDVAINRIQIVMVGLPVISTMEMNKVSTKYGFTNVALGCIVSQNELNGVKMYNKEMNKYLMEKNGKDWMSLYNMEIDSLIELITSNPESGRY